jgi:Putative capsular polysaccharide synthesis protein
MGIAKSGTSAVAAALRNAGVPRVFQIHSLRRGVLADTERDYRERNPGRRPHPVWDAQYLAERLPAPGSPWQLVVTVREPVGQLVAAYFQTESRRGTLAGATVDSLLATFDHDFTRLVDRWADVQVRDVLGLDLFAHPFDPAVGHATIERPDMRVLVLRRESLDLAPEALSRFLRRPEPIALPRTNVGADKDYADLYADFLDAVRPSDEVLDRAYGSALVRHFYSPAEIASFRARWTRR